LDWYFAANELSSKTRVCQFTLRKYAPEQRIVLSVKPGITEPASLAYRHEEEILTGHAVSGAFFIARTSWDKLAQTSCISKTLRCGAIVASFPIPFCLVSVVRE